MHFDFRRSKEQFAVHCRNIGFCKGKIIIWFELIFNLGLFKIQKIIAIHNIFRLIFTDDLELFVGQMDVMDFLMLNQLLKLFLCLSVEKTKVVKTIIRIAYFDLILCIMLCMMIIASMDIDNFFQLIEQRMDLTWY